MNRRFRWLAYSTLLLIASLPLMALPGASTPAHAQARVIRSAETINIPRTGRPVPALADFEDVVLTLMREHEISAATLGIMKDGRIVLERGYGWLDEGKTIPLPPNALMRIASVSKPITAAAIRELIAEGRIRLNDKAFDLGQLGGGILPHQPFPELGDERLKDITVEHLLLHHGGWDRSDAGDLTFREIAIARAMDVPSPPGRDDILRYILGQPLQFDPGSQRVYSNVGYLVLGMIIEHVTGQPAMNYIHQRVLRPLGVRPTEHRLGRTHKANRDRREPYYDHPSPSPNVFDPDGPRVPAPYGRWCHENKIGHGGHISTTRSLLLFLQARYISGPNIGIPRGGRETLNWRRNHTGSLPGTSAIARQRGDGVHYVVIFNKRAANDSSYYATTIRSAFDELLNHTQINWPAP